LAQRKIKLAGSPAVDGGPQIDLNRAGDSFFLKASMKVGVPGVDREVAQELAEAAHGVCPYSRRSTATSRSRRSSSDEAAQAAVPPVTLLSS